LSELEYRALLDLDIEKSSGRGRTPSAEIRRVLREATRYSLGRNGIAPDRCIIADLGDGLRVVATPGTPKADLLNTVIHDLAIRLRRHNRAVGLDSPMRIRVRAALHAGEVDVEESGAVDGRPLEVLARLLEAAELREALRSAPADTPVALIMSGHYYEDAVAYGSLGVLPEEFVPRHIGVKEFAGSAWIFVPAFAAPTPPLEGEPMAAAKELEALAGTGAAALVAAMATDSWSSVKRLVAALFRRAGADRTRAVQARLDADARLIEGARDPEAARRSLLDLWTGELGTLLRDFPAAAAELTGLVDGFAKPAPADKGSRQISQVVIVGQGATANTIGEGNVIHYGIPAPPAPRPATTAGPADPPDGADGGTAAETR
jgi:hypothetical protein